MDFQEDIRKQQLLDKINVIRTITPEAQESAAEPISKSLFDEFEGSDVGGIEKSLNTVGSLLGDSEVDEIEKAIAHRYFKREGTKGNYKYYYTEADYKAGKSGGEHESNEYIDPEFEREVKEFDEYHKKGGEASKEFNEDQKKIAARLKVEGKDSDKKEEKELTEDDKQLLNVLNHDIVSYKNEYLSHEKTFGKKWTKEDFDEQQKAIDKLYDKVDEVTGKVTPKVTRESWKPYRPELQ